MAATKGILSKQIVYLFGAGATFAEVKYRNARPLVNTLMRNIETSDGVFLEGVATRVLREFGQVSSLFDDIGVDQDADIEKLISLLTASGVETSVVTSKPANGGRVKTGQRISRLGR